MDCIDHGVVKIQTRLSHFHFNDLKKRSLLHYCKNQISYSFNILIKRSRKYIGEGDGTPLQCSGLENSMDRIVHGVAKSRTLLSDFTSFTSYFITGEGNGSPLQYSCLENPMDRGTWQAMVHGVAESRT